MAASAALTQALALWRAPTLAAAMRERPLPAGVLSLIKIAAGDPEARAEAEAVTSETPDRIREAAVLYLQNVLLMPGADHYRALAVAPDAPQERLREHLVWMIKWLHPDRTGSEWESAFVQRVLNAWDALKTKERRLAYDLAMATPPGRGDSRPSILGRQVRNRVVSRGAPVGIFPRLQFRPVVVVSVCLAVATVAWAASRLISDADGLSAAATEPEGRAASSPADNQAALDAFADAPAGRGR